MTKPLPQEILTIMQEIRFVKEGGSCFECCDYEGMVQQLGEVLQKHLSLPQQEEKLCESDGMVYTSNPPQSKCKYCGKFWIDKIPVCGKLEQEEPKQIDWIMVEMMPGVNREVKNIEQTIQLLLDTINRQQEQINSLL